MFDARIRSLIICHTVMLVISLGSSIVFTSIWPYLQLLDPDVTLEQYSFVVAADAFGNVVSSPIAGWAYDKIGSVRPVGFVTQGLFLGGNVFYALLSLIPRGGPDSHDPRVWLALLSRFIVGCGTGVAAALRGYISKVTTNEERITHVALISLFQMLGLILGPAFQAALTPIGEKEIDADPDIVLDMYTMTGWVSAVNGTIGLILFLPGIFVEFHAPPDAKSAAKKDGQDNSANTISHDEVDVITEDRNKKSSVSTIGSASSIDDEQPNSEVKPIPRKKPKPMIRQYSRVSVLDAQTFFTLGEDKDSDDESEAEVNTKMPHWFDIFTCIYSFFSFFISFVLVDTLISPLALDQWGWAPEDMILYTGITMAGGGILATFCFASIAPLSKYFDERLMLLLGGIVPMVISRLVCLPWGSEHPPMTYNATVECDDFFNITDAPVTISENGCEYCWCLDVPLLGTTQFMIGYGISMVAFPFCVTIVAAIFSKMLGRNPQGLWMGMMTMAGGLARVIGPIGFAFIYEEVGTYATFGTLAALPAISGVLVLISYKRLVPQE